MGKKNKEFISRFIVMLSLFLFAYIPTSKSGQFIDLKITIALWVFALAVITVFVSINYISKINLFLGTLLMLYMSFVTYIALENNTDIRFSIARVAPILSIILLSIVVIKVDISFKFMVKLIDFFMFSSIVWNLGLIIKVPFFQEFTINNYSQFFEMAVTSQVIKQKPVMSFGVHSFASFFYMIIFLLCYLTVIKIYSKKRFYIYMIFLFTFNIMLRSTTSLIFSIIMLLLFWVQIRNFNLKIVFLIIIIIVSLFFVPNMIYNDYNNILSSDIHGFAPRYFGAAEYYSGNLEFISNNILGLGFNISEKYQILYTDSGYIVFFTMGNILLVIGLYYLLYRFLKNNLSVKHKNFMFFLIMLFEFAIPNVIYIKFFFVLIFTIYYLRSLEKHKLS